MSKNTEELGKICDFLKKQCHHEDCTNVYRCPETHLNCQAGLDIYTALLWEMTIQIERFGETYNRQLQIDIRKRFITLLTVLDYHGEKYEEVFYSARCASILMWEIIQAEEDSEELEDRMYD